MKNKPFNIHYLLLLLVCTISCESNDSESGVKDRPNIVLIIRNESVPSLVDGVNYDLIKTPVLDRLNASGVIFESTYLPSSSVDDLYLSILMGMTPDVYTNKKDSLVATDLIHADKVYNSQYELIPFFKTLPAVMEDNFYASYLAGQLLGLSSYELGFSSGFDIEKTEDVEKANDLLANQLASIDDFLGDTEANPFFIWYSPDLLGDSIQVPERFISLYSDMGINEKEKQFYSRSSWFDYSIGKMISLLKDRDLYSNTLFIYIDNARFDLDAGEVVESENRTVDSFDINIVNIVDIKSLKTNLLFSMPSKIPAKQERHQLVNTYNLSATIFDLIGVEKPESFSSNSFSKIILNDVELNKDLVIGRLDNEENTDEKSESSHDVYFASDEKWLFKWNLSTGEKSIYDLLNDPECMYDVQELRQSEVSYFSAKVLEWRQKNEAWNH